MVIQLLLISVTVHMCGLFYNRFLNRNDKVAKISKSEEAKYVEVEKNNGVVTNSIKQSSTTYNDNYLYEDCEDPNMVDEVYNNSLNNTHGTSSIFIDNYFPEDNDDYVKTIRKIELIDDMYKTFDDVDIDDHFDVDMLKLFYYFETEKKVELSFYIGHIHDYIKFIDFTVLNPQISRKHYRYISKSINKGNFRYFEHLFSDNVNICSSLIIYLPIDVAKLFKDFKDYEDLWLDHKYERFDHSSVKLLRFTSENLYKYVNTIPTHTNNNRSISYLRYGNAATNICINYEGITLNIYNKYHKYIFTM